MGKFFLFFLLCLLLALLLNLPVQHVLPHAKLPKNLRAAGIDGTLLHGSVDEIELDNFSLYQVDYRFLPSCLPLLKACYRVRSSQGEMRLAYDVLNGDTEVSHTRVEYPAAELAVYMPNLPLRPGGRLELVVDAMSMLDGKPRAASGRLIWRDLGVADEDIELNIGDYQLDFNGDQREYRFKVSDLNASLDVSGDGKVGPGGVYEVDLRIESEDAIEPRIKTLLELVAATNGYNKYRIERKGRLPPNVASRIF